MKMMVGDNDECDDDNDDDNNRGAVTPVCYNCIEEGEMVGIAVGNKCFSLFQV